MSSTVHTIGPIPAPEGYFSPENVTFLQRKITETLSKSFTTKVLFDRQGIVRIMERVIKERLESVPRMNRRVIMYCCNEFSNHQIEVKKQLKWAEGYQSSQKLYDPVGGIVRADLSGMKLANRLGKQRSGGTLRFHFV